MNWREVGTRALLTFVQAFLAVLLVDGLNGLDDWEAVQPAVIAALIYVGVQFSQTELVPLNLKS